MYNCKYQTIRSKKYKKYYFCRNPKINNIINYKDCYDCNLKEYKKQKPIPNKKKKRTIATSIPKSVKEIVWERDNHKCIFCHVFVPVDCACCHFIPRSQGGLGIPENIFTACNKCHSEQDNGLNTIELEKIAEDHLKKYYGNKWKKKDLIYKKN
jgi:5-methylcytosine-specific restriction endonuclease McrA